MGIKTDNDLSTGNGCNVAAFSRALVRITGARAVLVLVVIGQKKSNPAKKGEASAKIRKRKWKRKSEEY